MLLQGMDCKFLLLGGEMRVDIHGHGRIGVPEKILRGLYIYACVIEHRGVCVSKLVRRESVHSNDFRIVAACVTSACLNVQIVHISRISTFTYNLVCDDKGKAPPEMIRRGFAQESHEKALPLTCS